MSKEETQEIYDKDGPDLRIGDKVNLGWFTISESDGHDKTPYAFDINTYFSRADLHGLPIRRNTHQTITGTIIEEKVVDGKTIVTMEVENE